MVKLPEEDLNAAENAFALALERLIGEHLRLGARPMGIASALFYHMSHLMVMDAPNKAVLDRVTAEQCLLIAALYKQLRPQHR